MIQRPKSCEGCPLHTQSRPGFVPDELVPNPEYTIVAEAPGSTEIGEGKPLVGKAGFVLKQWIMRAVPAVQIAYDRKQVNLCNVLKCLPPEVQGRPYPTGETKRQAEAHCAQYLNIGNPKTVILAGESPQRYFFGPELEQEDLVDKQLGHSAKGVMGRVGRVYEKDGKRWVFAPHPAFVLRQPSLVRHAQESFKIASGEAKVLDTSYVDWQDAMRELLCH